MGRHTRNIDAVIIEFETGFPEEYRHHTNVERALYELNRKVNAIMADFNALDAAVTAVQNDDHAAAAELAALAEQVKTLTAGSPVDQETIDNITTSLTNATQSLASATTAVEPAPAVTPADASSGTGAQASSDSATPAAADNAAADPSTAEAPAPDGAVTPDPAADNPVADAVQAAS